MRSGDRPALADARGAFLPVLAGLVALAWLTLLLWAQSPYGRYLDHGQWTEIGIAGELCRALPAGTIILPAVLYVGGWMLMTAAMMLPTTLPLLARFDRLTELKPHRRLLSALLISGYLAVWGAFGLAAHLLDAGLHVLVAGTSWLMLNGWIVGASVLATAGAFQFSALKYRCLDQCRTPFSSLNAHWRGRAPAREALWLGVHHGIFCVGCCWAIMLLMFVVGTGNVGWMLLLGAVMAAEKTMPWGSRLRAPLGIALLAWSGTVVAGHAWGWLV
jgi:predicted metal-binding membrane protein